MPSVSQASLFSRECPGVFGAKLPTPVSDGLVGGYDSTLCQEVFNISEAQAESVVEPNGVAYNFRRESVSSIAGRLGYH